MKASKIIEDFALAAEEYRAIQRKKMDAVIVRCPENAEKIEKASSRFDEASSSIDRVMAAAANAETKRLIVLFEMTEAWNKQPGTYLWTPARLNNDADYLEGGAFK